MEVEPIQNIIDSYEAYLRRGLKDEDGLEDEVLVVLNDRSIIEDRWDELSPADRQRVARLDDVLVEKRSLIATILPYAGVKNRRHWWWFLDEGPQVRDQAGEAA